MQTRHINYLHLIYFYNFIVLYYGLWGANMLYNVLMGRAEEVFKCIAEFLIAQNLRRP